MIQQTCQTYHYQEELKNKLILINNSSNPTTYNVTPNQIAKAEIHIHLLLDKSTKQSSQELFSLYQILISQCQAENLSRILVMHKPALNKNLKAQQELFKIMQKLFSSFLELNFKNDSNAQLKKYQQKVNVLIDFIMIQNTQFCSQIISRCIHNKKFCYQFLVCFNQTIFSKQWNEQNQDLAEDCPLNGYDLNQISYLVFIIIKNQVKENSYLIDQALRFITVLVSLKPQQMQIFDQILLTKLSEMLSNSNDKRQVGFAYRLISLYLKTYRQKGQIILNEDFFFSVYSKLSKIINTNQKEFENQIQKLQHNLNFIQKRNSIGFLRGVSIFCYQATKYLSFIKSRNCFTFLQFANSIIHCNDPVIFQVNFQTLNEFNIQIDQDKLLQSIVNNCPKPRQSLQVKNNKIQENILKINYFNDNQYCSTSFNKNINQILSRMDIIENQSLVLLQKVHQKIQIKIQKQFDTQFNQYQFISASNCLFYLVDYAISKSGSSSTDIKPLKEQLINQIKFLMNLNESCLAQHKKIVCQKIIQLFSHCYEVVLPQNQFLQQVIQKLLIQKYPNSKLELLKLIQFYQSTVDIFQKGYANKFSQSKYFNNEPLSSKKILNSQIRKIKLIQNICNCLIKQKISILDKSLLWQIIFRVCKIKPSSSQAQSLSQSQPYEKSMINMRQINAIYSLKPDQYIAKLLAAKKLKINQIYEKRDMDKINSVKQIYKGYQLFYEQELESISKLR